MSQTAASDPLEQETEQAEQEHRGIDLDHVNDVQFQNLASLLGGGGLGTIDYVGKIIDDFKIVTDKNIAKKLLHSQNPQEELAKLDKSIKQLEKRIEKRKKKTQGKESHTEFNLFGFYKFKVTEDFLNRRKDVSSFTKNVYKVVDNHAKQLQIDTVVSHFGLTDDTKAQLQENLSKWQQENPGKDFQDELKKQTNELYKKQTGKSLEKKDWKDRQLSTEFNYENAYNKAHKQLSDQGLFKRAEEVIDNNITNPSNTRASQEQLNEYLTYAQTGKLPETGASTQQKLSGGFSEIDESLADDIVGDYKPIKVQQPTPQQHASTPPQPPSTSTPRIPLFQKIKTAFSNVSQRITSFFNKIPLIGKHISSAAGLFTGGVGSLFEKAMSSVATRVAVKLGVSGAIKAAGLALNAIPGVGTIASAFLFLGGDKVVKKFLIYLGITVFGIIVFVFLIGAGEFSHIVTPENPQALHRRNIPTLSWNEFETLYLTHGRNGGEVAGVGDITSSDWESFEQNHLLPQKTYLSILDTDRHDDMEK